MMTDPLALIALKETGQCEVRLPETLFDADYPGHYMRRFKNVSLTIPCVVGPHTSINCTLTLLSNKTRTSSVVGSEYAEQVDAEDQRFVSSFAATQSIATSHAQNDTGMFELNFRDERYLPFEGAGAISRWRIEMPKESNAFDFSTLTDVVLHLRYTARDGGGMLKKAAKESLTKTIQDQEPPFERLFSLKHEFPTEWYHFLHVVDSDETGHTMQLNLTKERFPYQLRGKGITLNSITLFVKIAESFVYDAPKNALAIHVNQDSHRLKRMEFLTTGSPVSGLPYVKSEMESVEVPANLELEVLTTELPNPLAALATTWWQSIKVNGVGQARLRSEAIDDIWMLCQYSINSRSTSHLNDVRLKRFSVSGMVNLTQVKTRIENSTR